jgi:protein-arginine kinase activator protein McsA
VHALSVLVEQEQTIYDITVDRKEFFVTLEQNLSILEKNEEYETCAEVVKAIKFLKEKKVKD